MEQKESANLGNKEKLEEIKDKCKSRAQIGCYVGLAALFLLIVLVVICIIYNGTHNLQHRKIMAYIYMLLFICAAGWCWLNNYRFYRNIDGLDTPDQLLHSYKKKVKNERGPFFLIQLSALCYLIDGAFFLDPDPLFRAVMVIVVIVLFALMINRYKKVESYYSSRDIEIIEQLQELTNK